MVLNVKEKPVEEWRAIQYNGENLPEVIEFCLEYTVTKWNGEDIFVKIGDSFCCVHKDWYIVSDFEGVRIMHPDEFNYKFYNKDKYKFKLEKRYE